MDASKMNKYELAMARAELWDSLALTIGRLLELDRCGVHRDPAVMKHPELDAIKAEAENWAVVLRQAPYLPPAHPDPMTGGRPQ